MQHPAALLDGLRSLIQEHRPMDAERAAALMTSHQADPYLAETLAYELWGMPLALVLSASPTDLVPDWREDRATRRRLVPQFGGAL